MVRAQSSIAVRASADDCYRFVAVDFFRNYPRWSPEVVLVKPLSDGPLQVGSRGYQVRVDRGRRSESSFRVSLLQDGRRVTFRGISAPFAADYRFKPAGDRTRITFTFVLERLDLKMRPFAPLIRRTTQEGAERTVHNLKRLIESESPPSPPRGD
jgi:hypothetical protein